MSEEEIIEEEVGEVIDLDEIAKKYEDKGLVLDNLCLCND